MATRPDIPANASHEERVRAFMSSIPERRLRSLERRFPILEGDLEAEVRFQEETWSPLTLDQVVITEGPVHRTPHRGEPEYLEES